MLIEKLLQNSSVEMAYIDGRKVAELCYGGEIDVANKPSNDELFDCINNKDEVSKSIRIPSLMFKGHEGPIKAAVVIQKNWRMHKARVAYTYLRFLIKKATMIQQAYRLFLFQKKTKDEV